jgi:hypothetical protein
MERKYTLAEIDAMRELVEHELNPHGHHGGYHVGGGSSSSELSNLVYAQQRQVQAAMVEDRLRTYLVAGLGPEDLKRLPSPS